MVDSLKIALDNQRRWVYPGGILSGTVIIQVSEPVKARAVEIRFEGKASCGWTEYEYRPSVYYDGRYRSRHRWVNYDAEIVYANHEQVVWGPPSGQGVLQPGTHQCRFQFQVPQNAGPTFEGRHGHIRYHLKAKIDRPWRVDDTCFLPLTVMPYFDLNALPYAGHPLLREIHRDLRCCCLSYGRMLVRLFVNKSGFVPGEAIPIRMEIENSSDKGTHNFQATVKKIGHEECCRRHQAITKYSSTKKWIGGKWIGLLVPLHMLLIPNGPL
uniref:Arrestin_N domain-containing protein n=1 Tax=Bursaphelenchus xylophilus TaxID=6326 RepID=A0A1I7SHY8_BURXY